MGRFRYRLQPLLNRAAALERRAEHEAALRLAAVRCCATVLERSNRLHSWAAGPRVQAAEFVMEAEWRERERTRLCLAQTHLAEAREVLEQRRRFCKALERHKARALRLFEALRERRLERECDEQNAALTAVRLR